jgi:hypothetical protein
MLAVTGGRVEDSAVEDNQPANRSALQERHRWNFVGHLDIFACLNDRIQQNEGFENRRGSKRCSDLAGKSPTSGGKRDPFALCAASPPHFLEGSTSCLKLLKSNLVG